MRQPSFREPMDVPVSTRIESRWRPHPRGAAATGHEAASIIVGRDMLRTAFWTFLLGGIAAFLAYFSIGAVAGEGRSIFRLTATVAVFLACGAAASRRRKWLMSLLALGSLCAFALLVDQLVYHHWHERVDSLVTGLKQGIESGSPALPEQENLRPTSFWIDPDQEVLLTFEPPLLAWTYHLDSASPLGHTLIAGWYRLLSSVPRRTDIDPITRTIIHPHEAYAIGVRSAEKTTMCQDNCKGNWILYIDSRSGTRPI
jgi:hypothetical protein